jgi:hypothetical protein
MVARDDAPQICIAESKRRNKKNPLSVSLDIVIRLKGQRIQERFKTNPNWNFLHNHLKNRESVHGVHTRKMQ